MAALAEQKIIAQKLIRQASVGAPIAGLFPLTTEESLKAIEEKILPENREIFVSTIKRLLQQSATRNLKNISDDSIVLNHNLDGTHGKKDSKHTRNSMLLFWIQFRNCRSSTMQRTTYERPPI